MKETNKNLRVLLVSPLPPPAGGIASWTKEYLVSAKECGVNVDIVNVAVIGKRKLNINAKSNLFDEFFRSINIIRTLHKKIKFFRPTVVHINTPCGRMGIIRDYFCAQITRFHKVKLVVHYRCNIEDQITKKTIQSFVFHKLAKTASINLVLNEPSKLYLESESGAKSQIIANFIEEDFLIKRDKLISNHIRRISFTGHVRKSKGVFEIIEVAKRLPNIRFSLAGPISVEAKKQVYPKNVEFVGSVSKEDVKGLLDNSDVFLFPTYTEGFSNALLEAMARGVPIVTTAVGANQAMIEDKGGLIVKTMDIDSIVDAINALDDKNKRSEMSKWNVEKVRSSYLVNEVFESLLKIYAKLETKEGENELELRREN